MKPLCAPTGGQLKPSDWAWTGVGRGHLVLSGIDIVCDLAGASRFVDGPQGTVEGQIAAAIRARK